MIRCNRCNYMNPPTSFASSLKFLIFFVRLPSTSIRNLTRSYFPTPLILNFAFQIYLSRTCPYLHRHRMNLKEEQVFGLFYLRLLISCFIMPIVEPLKAEAFVSLFILIVSV
jgi:hypothetical protein